MAQDAASSAPTWTNLPAGAVTYSIEGPPGGSNLNVTPAVGNDGAVTVPKDAHAAAEDWTVTAAAGGSAYTAKITITVNPKEHTIGTVSYSDAVISAKTDFQIAPRVPSLTDALPSGAAAVYTVDPALPAGMDLDPETGEITGTPEAEQAETEHTVTLTLTGNYSGTATASITVTVTADARAPWVESLVYVTDSLFVEVKGGAVAGEVIITQPVLTQKTDVTSSITAEYSSVENRAAVDSSTGEITISAGTVLSDIDGNGFTFNIKVIDSGGAYADFQETVTVNLQKVKSIAFGTPPALTYGDAPQMLTAPAVDAANGAGTAVTYSTSDAAVADVDSGTGELTIAAAGEVTITATSTFDTSVKGEQTLTIAQKDINALTNLTFGDLTAYAGIEFSGAITVSGLIGGDTMAEALSFEPIITGTVRVDADGALTIPLQSNTDNHNTVHDITVNGTGSYTGSKDIQVTLNVLDSPFSYTSGITTTYGTEGQSQEPVWTNPPAGTVVYSLEGSPQGVSVDDTNGVVTVGPAADVRNTAQITVKAADAEAEEYVASLTVTVTAKDIATVQGFSISVDDKTATAKSTDSTHSAVIGGTLAATTDYTLQITDSSNNVPGFMSIAADGDIAIADSIAVSDGGTYTVTAAGTGNYSGTTNADFTLTVEPKDIATVTDFSISVDDQDVPPESTFSVTINNAGLTAGNDYDLSIEKSGAAVGAVTIDSDGLVSISSMIGTGDAGTYTVKAAGKTNSNYTGEKTADFNLTVIEELVYSVGDPGPAGGKIFYVNPNTGDGWTYLEAASQDHIAIVQWGGAGTLLNTMSTDIGSGKANTEAIVGALGDNGGTDYAAKICSEYTVNHNGVDYDDWFLPSKDELNELYNQKDSVGGFASNYYWSSSEYSADGAWDQYFGDGGQGNYGKDVASHVLAVRAF